MNTAGLMPMGIPRTWRAYQGRIRPGAGHHQGGGEGGGSREASSEEKVSAVVAPACRWVGATLRAAVPRLVF